MFRNRSVALALAAVMGLAAVAAAQQQRPPVPKPFPQPAKPSTAKPAAEAGAAVELPLTAEALGVPIYPTAQFLDSYDAGRGQRYYLFGSAATFAEIVAYYRTVLKQRGELVFEEPPTHMFEVGRFRDEDVAFPPGVTVKDYTTGGSLGYPNPKPAGQPARFPTIIQIVPHPQG